MNTSVPANIAVDVSRGTALQPLRCQQQVICTLAACSLARSKMLQKAKHAFQRLPGDGHSDAFRTQICWRSWSVPGRMLLSVPLLGPVHCQPVFSVTSQADLQVAHSLLARCPTPFCVQLLAQSACTTPSMNTLPSRCGVVQVGAGSQVASVPS